MLLRVRPCFLGHRQSRYRSDTATCWLVVLPEQPVAKGRHAHIQTSRQSARHPLQMLLESSRQSPMTTLYHARFDQGGHNIGTNSGDVTRNDNKAAGIQWRNAHAAQTQKSISRPVRAYLCHFHVIKSAKRKTLRILESSRSPNSHALAQSSCCAA